jgi:diguanylate cyclase (GGDEF)-like protein/PAS domain S-box-containing protein
VAPPFTQPCATLRALPPIDAASYGWSPYALPTALTAAAMLGLGIGILARERGSREGRLFLLVAATVSAWLACFSLMYLSREEATALRWGHLAYLGIALIPMAVYHFAVAVSRDLERRRRWLWAGWTVAVLFALAMARTDALFRDLYVYRWGFYPRFRWLGALFLVFFFAAVVASLRQFWAGARRGEGTFGARCRAFFVAFAVASLGSVDYLAAYGVPLYPFGYLPVLVFIVLAAQAIRRYRLVDFTPEMAARGILRDMLDALVVCDREGIVRLVNPAAVELLGYAAEELVGRPLASLAAPGAEPAARRLAVGVGGPTGTAELTLRSKSGDAVEVELSSGPIEDSGAALVGSVLLLRDVRPRKRAEAALRHSEALFRSLAESTPAVIFISEGERFQYANPATALITGRGREELLAMRSWEIARPDARERLRLLLSGLGPHSPPARLELPVAAEDGQQRWLDLTATPVAGGSGSAVVATAFDITESKLAAEAARSSERRLSDLLETVELIALTLDPRGQVTYCNQFLLELLGCEAEEVIGGEWFERWVPAEQRAAVAESFHAKIAAGELAAHDEHEIQTRDGSRRLIAWNNTVLRDRQGVVTGAASIGVDLTERKRAEERLVHETLHDALTGLPNRVLFMDRVSAAIARGKRRTGTRYGVLFLDLDRFKVINDSLGHLLGDRLLVQVSRRLERCLRPGDTIARLGGDEFTLLLEDLVDDDDAARVAERIKVELAAPFDLDGNEVVTSASIGIALGGPRHQQAEQLLRDADTALHRAKAEGKARHRIFDTPMHVRAVERLELEGDLRHAIERGEFSIFYQPIVRFATREVVAFEALVRWRHPRRGLLTPNEFIPLAEESGLIAPFGRWLLGEACRQIREWDQAFAYAEQLAMTVNLSSRQFGQPDLVEQVAQVLFDSGVQPSRLRLEVTESLIVEDPEAAAQMLANIKKLGCRVCLDDFGTGYSSLSYLLRLPIDMLKVDRSFLTDLGRGTRNADIVWAVLELGRRLGMEVVAEGVETDSQLVHLRELGCEYGQGYLFARPLEAERATAYLAERQPAGLPPEAAS